jgi:hypothetical protein
MALTKLPGSKWWIETDDVTNEIIGEYNKANIIADIEAIRDTLAKLPDPDQESSDYADILIVLVGKWTPTKNARIVAMLGRMKDAYGGSQQSVETAQLIAKLNNLIALRDRLV